MLNRVRRIRVAAGLTACLAVSPALAAPLEVPFDFSRGAVGVNVMVRSAPLFALLDTGVDPSVIDAVRAKTLGLKVDLKSGGEVSGTGNSASAIAYPTTIDSLAVAGRPFAPIEALAADLNAISGGYGKPIDAVLGYSFLRDKTVLVDYARRRLEISSRPGELTPLTRGCRTHFTLPLQFLGSDNTPIIPAFRFASATGPGTLDTGSNEAVTLFPRALALPGVRAALVQKGEVTSAGARGQGTSKTYVLNGPVGFGPFSLPAGQVVKVGQPQGDGDMRVANLGNPLFSALKLEVLLDYRSKRITFYGRCPGG